MESDFFSSGGSVFHTFPTTSLSVSIPRPVVFSFGSFSLSEHLKSMILEMVVVLF